MRERLPILLVGRFISPDPLVPEPEKPQAFNRFAYVYNNPLRYTDPTGYFTDDEIKESLRKFYQDNGYDNVDELVEHTWEMWQKDPGFVKALGEAEVGDIIWASHMTLDGQAAPGYGTFQRQDDRVTIEWTYTDDQRAGQETALDLYQLQGQGAYQLSKNDGFVWSSCPGGSCYELQENYNYFYGVPTNSLGTAGVLWEETLFGANPYGPAPRVWELVLDMDMSDRQIPRWPTSPSWARRSAGGWLGVVNTAYSTGQALKSTLYEPGVWVMK